MRWPFVSLRAYELLEATVAQLRDERNELQLQRERLFDRLISNSGIPPMSTVARQETDAALAAIDEQMTQFDDAGDGQMSAEILEMAAELGAVPN